MRESPFSLKAPVVERPLELKTVQEVTECLADLKLVPRCLDLIKDREIRERVQCELVIASAEAGDMHTARMALSQISKNTIFYVRAELYLAEAAQKTGEGPKMLIKDAISQIQTWDDVYVRNFGIADLAGCYARLGWDEKALGLLDKIQGEGEVEQRQRAILSLFEAQLEREDFSQAIVTLQRLVGKEKEVAHAKFTDTVQGHREPVEPGEELPVQIKKRVAELLEANNSGLHDIELGQLAVRLAQFSAQGIHFSMYQFSKMSISHRRVILQELSQKHQVVKNVFVSSLSPEERILIESPKKTNEQLFVERLNDRLKELDLDAFSPKLRAAYVVGGDLELPREEKEVRGIVLDAYGIGRQFLHVKYDLYPHEDYFYAYRDLLERMEGLKDRPISEEKKLKMIYDLDTRRRALHNLVGEFVRTQIEKSKKIRMDLASGRKLFEVLYTIWNIPKEGQRLTYDEDGLVNVDLDLLTNDLFDKFGVRVEITSFTYGWHDDCPAEQYEVKFLDPIDDATLGDIDTFIKKMAGIR